MNHTILIVDDEKNYLFVLEDLLVDEGYQVVTADAALQAVEVLAHNDFDVVITDMKMRVWTAWLCWSMSTTSTRICPW